MAKTLDIERILSEDDVACAISDKYMTWEMLRETRKREWQEVLEYVFATDTTKTSNSKLLWSNKTTIPKLCQIRDNLHSNYMAALFPKQKWLTWIGDKEDDESKEKVEAIESYMQWVTNRNQYYNTVSQLVYDYIDCGNAFVMPEWSDDTNLTESKEQVGYVGPKARRISPLDIVFDPTALSFEEAPKIVRSTISLGEVKEILARQSVDEGEKENAQAIYSYLREIRSTASKYSESNIRVKDRIYSIAGFSSFHQYLASNNVEVLTFYGDFYDAEKDELLKNYVIKVVDRHKIISKKPNVSSFGYAPIFHAGWRLRPDNLWAMGPLDNLVGMQYRIDHLENMKADCFDLIAYPPVKIKGQVEDFDWEPLARIYLGDDGDVAFLTPDVMVLQADNQIAILEAKMEEMSGSPKEAMGFRTPGEKTKYEVQSLENAASRIFTNKIQHFEKHIVENLLNSMLELARRNMTASVIRTFDDEFKIGVFKQLSRYDITGHGRLHPMASRHFAEQANLVQNLTSFFQSAAGQDPEVRQHFSSVKLAQMWEHMLEADPYNIVEPFIRLTEQADAQRLANTHEQQVGVEQQTASGLNGDFDLEELNNPTDIQS